MAEKIMVEEFFHSRILHMIEEMKKDKDYFEKSEYKYSNFLLIRWICRIDIEPEFKNNEKYHYYIRPEMYDDTIVGVKIYKEEVYTDINEVELVYLFNDEEKKLISNAIDEMRKNNPSEGK